MIDSEVIIKLLILKKGGVSTKRVFYNPVWFLSLRKKRGVSKSLAKSSEILGGGGAVELSGSILTSPSPLVLPACWISSSPSSSTPGHRGINVSLKRTLESLLARSTASTVPFACPFAQHFTWPIQELVF